MNQKRIKAPARRAILRQADIDAPDPPRRQQISFHEALDYVNGIPGFFLTTTVLVLFVVGICMLYVLYGMDNSAIRATSVRG